MIFKLFNYIEAFFDSIFMIHIFLLIGVMCLSNYVFYSYINQMNRKWNERLNIEPIPRQDYRIYGVWFISFEIFIDIFINLLIV